MAAPVLLLDEDARVVLADILRQRGYDAIHVLEIGRAGRSDLEQFTYAVSQERALLTHNIRDFLAIDDRYRTEGHEHFGIIVSDHCSVARSLAPNTSMFEPTEIMLCRVVKSDHGGHGECLAVGCVPRTIQLGFNEQTDFHRYHDCALYDSVRQGYQAEGVFMDTYDKVRRPM
ncbi:hypothetical protein BH18PSE1_BH18PSE1_06330 [soil metagenome]